MPAGCEAVSAPARPGSRSVSPHRVLHPAVLSPACTVTTACWPAVSAMRCGRTCARLLNDTSWLVTATGFPAAVMLTPAQPLSEQFAWLALRSRMFQATLPIPSAGSPAIALGTVMLS